MQIPKYWKRITKSVKGIDVSKRARSTNNKGDVDISAWGYSNDSETEALANAQCRVQEIVKALQSPQYADFYYPNSVIKEDIIDTIVNGENDAIITRNRYGALVLNTRKMMFVDIDTPQREKRPGNFLQKLLGQKFVWKPLSNDEKRLHEDNKIKDIEAFCATHSEFGCRLYKTFAGLRIIVTHQPYLADSEEAQQIFDALGCDPLYQKLCLSQKCFRARLSPKPWRMSEKVSANTPYLSFRVTQNMLQNWQDADEKRLREYDKWTLEYDEASKRYASCQFIKHIGHAQISPSLNALIELHDNYTHANKTITLA